MKWSKKLRLTLTLQTVILLGVTVVIARFETPDYIFEVFGALMASIITVFGLLRMKKLTED